MKSVANGEPGRAGGRPGRLGLNGLRRPVRGQVRAQDFFDLDLEQAGFFV